MIVLFRKNTPSPGGRGAGKYCPHPLHKGIPWATVKGQAVVFCAWLMRRKISTDKYAPLTYAPHRAAVTLCGIRHPRMTICI